MPLKPILPRPHGCICLSDNCIVPYGLCHCGCGQKTTVADETSRKHHQYKGFPKMFISGHNTIHKRPDLSHVKPFKIDGVYCMLIPLSGGQFSIVDATDYQWLSQWRWTASWSPVIRGHYALRKERIDGSGRYRTI